MGTELKGVNSFFEGDWHPGEHYGGYFFWFIFVSNYHGCKEETINLIPQFLIDIIHKLVKPSHLGKLQIIQNINKQCSMSSPHF